MHAVHGIGDEIKEGDIRLVGGQYLWEGRVEIFLSGVWGTISDDEAGTTDAAVVCRQLGYNTQSKIIIHVSLILCTSNCVSYKVS